MKKYSKKALWELFYPIVFTIGLVTIAIYFSNTIKYDFVKISDSGLGAFGTIFGFLIAILTIINSLDNKYVRKLKKDDNFDFMQSYLKHAITTSFISIASCTFFSFVFSNTKSCYDQYFGFGLLFILIYSFLASYRFLSIFVKLMK